MTSFTFEPAIEESVDVAITVANIREQLNAPEQLIGADLEDIRDALFRLRSASPLDVKSHAAELLGLSIEFAQVALMLQRKFGDLQALTGAATVPVERRGQAHEWIDVAKHIFSREPLEKRYRQIQNAIRSGHPGHFHAILADGDDLKKANDPLHGGSIALGDQLIVKTQSELKRQLDEAPTRPHFVLGRLHDHGDEWVALVANQTDDEIATLVDHLHSQMDSHERPVSIAASSLELGQSFAALTDKLGEQVAVIKRRRKAR